MKGEKKREILFDFYSNNFKSVCDSQGWKIGCKNDGVIQDFEKPIYICPICFNFFQKSDLNQEVTNPLTLEDVPPKALGGKPLMLTCKQCNNHSGTTLDSQLKKDFDLSLFFKGISETTAKIKFQDENPFKSSISFDSEKNQMNFVFDRKNEYAKKQVEKLAEKWDSSEFNFTVTGSNKRKFSIGLLRIAYLLTFAKFGYSYLLSDGSKIVRSQITAPFDNIIGNKFVLNSDFINKEKQNTFIIKQSPNALFLLVVFELKKSSEKRNYGVVLPGPNKDDVSSYLDSEREGDIQFNLTKIPEFDYLEDAMSYHKLWYHLKHSG